MPAPGTVAEFVALTLKSGVLATDQIDDYLRRRSAGDDGPDSPRELAKALVADGLLTRLQAHQLLKGKWRNFIVGNKYLLLECLGHGGMGRVYLCSHQVMRRLVALKVLPNEQAADPKCLERFRREARAAAVLHHPNIAAAYDVDRDGPLHFLVMEYVDGVSLHDLVGRRSKLAPERAAHYIAQAALGLQHAFERGLVHRDIKPANILVDRQGVVKLLDLGLARFTHDRCDRLTRRLDTGRILGTIDYLAPEQAEDSHTVDIRADIYALGGTFYFLLTGQGALPAGNLAEKVVWQMMREPESVRELSPEVPVGMAAVVARMMAKEPAARYQTPAEVVAALAPWLSAPIPPPAEDELPRHCPAVRRAQPASTPDLVLPSGSWPSVVLPPPSPTPTHAQSVTLPSATLAPAVSVGSGGNVFLAPLLLPTGPSPDVPAWRRRLSTAACGLLTALIASWCALAGPPAGTPAAPPPPTNLAPADAPPPVERP